MEPPDSFGLWLKRRRKTLDLTREELAARVGCAVITIRKIEADERRPSLQIAERLAEQLAIPAAERAAFLEAARAERAVHRLAPPPSPPPPPLPAPPTPASPPLVRGYRLHERIGSGPRGELYRATQPGSGRELALKVISAAYADHPAFVRHFAVEAQRIARLEHPHIVPLADYWREPGGAYLVRPYLRDGALQPERDGPWPLERCAALLDQIGPALALAHRQGVVHGNLKPSNILTCGWRRAPRRREMRVAAPFERTAR
ncbi:MAG: helix-turn-helix domain-containing protein [Chloroflexales bacterium]|nr:helix-turn-helix domain-containing protein [Chloroflexales bacterium]